MKKGGRGREEKQQDEGREEEKGKMTPWLRPITISAQPSPDRSQNKTATLRFANVNWILLPLPLPSPPLLHPFLSNPLPHSLSPFVITEDKAPLPHAQRGESEQFTCESSLCFM